ncbi:MAG: hypothetical protein ACTH0V_05175 [Microbacteriaceae bacterium]
MSTINPAARAAREHDRRDNGQFGERQHDAPAHELPQPELPNVGTELVLERWNWRDEAEEMDTLDVDFRPVLDARSLDEIPEAGDVGEWDTFFYEAEDVGLHGGWDGPFTVRVDQDELVAYVEARRAAGQVDPIATIPNHPPAERAARTRRALAAAIGDDTGTVNLQRIADLHDPDDAAAWAAGAAKRLERSVDEQRLQPEFMEQRDADLIADVLALDTGHPRDAEYVRRVQTTAFAVADRLIGSATER